MQQQNNTKEQPVFDRNGFKRHKMSFANEQQLINYEQIRKQISHWEQLTSNIEEMNQSNDRNLIESVRQGIPHELRPKIWPMLIMAPSIKFEVLVEKFKQRQQLKEINLDIDRTMFNNINISNIKEKLRLVLNLIALAFPEMGYCQGLNFIAANILLVFDTEQTYRIMYHILCWQRHEALMTNLSKIHAKIYCLSKLIKKHYPKLYKTLTQCENQPLIFTSSWFITLFSNILPFIYVMRIFEIYLLEGEKILYRVALQIFKQKKKALKQYETEEQIITEMTNFKDFNFAMMNRFFSEMFEIQLSRKEIDAWENGYESKKASK